MGLLDNISGALRAALASNDSASLSGAINAVLARTGMGGLEGITAKLDQSGFGPQVQSWLSNGANLPISADQIRSALSDEHVQAIAKHFGLPVDAALNLISEHLPTAVDRASPNGTLQGS